MESGTAAPTQVPGTDADSSAEVLTEAQRRDPRFQKAREAGHGERGREMLEHAAQGAELDPEEEDSALDWLMGDPKPIVHEIPVEVETPQGMRTLTFICRRADLRKIDAIELRHMQQSTGRVDRLSADFEIVAEMCDAVRDSKGREVKLTSPEFRTVLTDGPRGSEPAESASAAIALERRLAGQEGLITLLAVEIRRVGGYDPQRIGTAQRRLVEASLG